MKGDNILIITTRYLHSNDKVGATFIYDQVNELKKKYGRVVVVAVRPNAPTFILKFLSPKRRRDLLAVDYVYDNVEVYFVKNFITPFTKRLWPDLALRKVIKLLKKINFNPDIVHAHRTWPCGTIAYRFNKISNTPYVVTAHGGDAYSLPLKGKYWNKVIEQSLNAALNVITVSKKNKEIMEKAMNVTNIHVIPNGFNDSKFLKSDKDKCRELFKLPLEKTIFISVGFLEPIKGYNYLIEAISKIDNSNLYFIVVGDGMQKQSLLQLAQDFGISNQINFVGAVSHEDVNKWLNAADFFIMPSLNEGVPTAMFEALACGLPVIASSVGGIPEIINNEKYGLLFKPQSSSEIEKSIKKAIDKEWSSNEIVEYSKKFIWSNLVEEIVKLY